MSKTLSSVAQQLWDSQVKADYLDENLGVRLSDTVTMRDGVVGSTYNFRSIGRGLARVRGAPSDQVTVMDVTHATQACVLEDWYASEFTDIFDQAKVNFSELSELSGVIAGAIKRRDDQLVIDALDAASSTAGSVDTNVGGTATGLNTAKLRRAKRYLDDQGAGPDRCFLHTAQGLEDMLGQTEVTSADYNNVRALSNGEVNTFLGFKFVMIPTRDEGGIDNPSGNLYTNFAYERSAVGFARAQGFSAGPNSRVDWDTSRLSWHSYGVLKAGCVVRDTDGFVDVTTTEA